LPVRAGDHEGVSLHITLIFYHISWLIVNSGIGELGQSHLDYLPHIGTLSHFSATHTPQSETFHIVPHAFYVVSSHFGANSMPYTIALSAKAKGGFETEKVV
jgi:hypothetical protein